MKSPLKQKQFWAKENNMEKPSEEIVRVFEERGLVKHAQEYKSMFKKGCKISEKEKKSLLQFAEYLRAVDSHEKQL